MKRFLLSLLFWLTIIQAKVLQLSVIDLEILQEDDYFGDEIYFHVLESRGKKATEFLTPKFPYSYSKKDLQKFDKVVLWRGSLSEAENLTLFISMIERDSPPWNNDDLLGAVSLKIHFNRGQAQTTWEAVNLKSNHRYEFSSDEAYLDIVHGNGHYKVQLKIQILPD